MTAPRLLHLRGEGAFRRFDHDGTTLDAPTETVRLATVEQAGADPVIDPAVYAAWLALRGGAAIIPCRPDGCAEDAVLIAQRTGELLVDRGEGLKPWPLATASAPAASSGLRFTPRAAPAAAVLDEPAALARDPHGRLWLLEHGAARVLLLDADALRLLDVVPFPAGADLVHLAAANAGVLAVDAAGPGLFLQPYGGEWSKVAFTGAPPPAGARPVAAAGRDDRLAALYLLAAPIFRAPGAPPVHAQIALIEGAVARLVDVPGLTNPLPMLVLPGGDLLLGELTGLPGGTLRFTRFTVIEGGLRTVATLGVRGFDGRAFFTDGCDRPVVTTARGLRPLFAVLEAPNHTEGRVETYALDSERYGCVWHRVLLEVCLPPGTAVTIEARTSDDLFPGELRRLPRAPAEGGAPTPDVDRFPLGSRTPDDAEGWTPVGALDRRAAWADVPFAPPSPSGIETLEGLIKNSPGRYLWLRVHLRGTKRQTPALAAVRATYPRPSILDYLPAFWRAEPGAAQAMDQALSLFEGVLTELDLRIEALPLLFDPRVCPADALDWLASFLALALDPRLSEAQRRTLVSEGAALFRARGTMPGLARLCSIVADCPVDIVEAFRLRRARGSVLGGAGSVLGPAFGLGGDAIDDSAPVPWEIALQAKHDEVMKRRADARAAPPDAALCPPDDPPAPLDPDPLIALCRRSAHQFTVVVFRPFDADAAAVLDAAIERSKPAHTLHELCWLEAGFRLGVTTYVGFGTRLGDADAFAPAVVGASPLGAPTLLSGPTPARALGTFVGGARIGEDTYQ
jgi:phage tail-like protein